MLRELKSLATYSEVEAAISELVRSQRPPDLVAQHRLATRVSLQAAKSIHNRYGLYEIDFLIQLLPLLSSATFATSPAKPTTLAQAPARMG